MPKSKNKKKPTQIEREIRTYNPTKSKFGKIVLLILAIGMFLAMLVAAIYGAIDVLTSSIMF
jgi:hypothetical protein